MAVPSTWRAPEPLGGFSISWTEIIIAGDGTGDGWRQFCLRDAGGIPARVDVTDLLAVHGYTVAEMLAGALLRQIEIVNTNGTDPADYSTEVALSTGNPNPTDAYLRAYPEKEGIKLQYTSRAEVFEWWLKTDNGPTEVNITIRWDIPRT